MLLSRDAASAWWEILLGTLINIFGKILISLHAQKKVGKNCCKLENGPMMMISEPYCFVDGCAEFTADDRSQSILSGLVGVRHAHAD